MTAPATTATATATTATATATAQTAASCGDTVGTVVTVRAVQHAVTAGKVVSQRLPPERSGLPGQQVLRRLLRLLLWLLLWGRR